MLRESSNYDRGFDVLDEMIQAAPVPMLLSATRILEDRVGRLKDAAHAALDRATELKIKLTSEGMDLREVTEDNIAAVDQFITDYTGLFSVVNRMLRCTLEISINSKLPVMANLSHGEDLDKFLLLSDTPHFCPLPFSRDRARARMLEEEPYYNQLHAEWLRVARAQPGFAAWETGDDIVCNAEPREGTLFQLRVTSSVAVRISMFSECNEVEVFLAPLCPLYVESVIEGSGVGQPDVVTMGIAERSEIEEESRKAEALREQKEVATQEAECKTRELAEKEEENKRLAEDEPRRLLEQQEEMRLLESPVKSIIVEERRSRIAWRIREATAILESSSSIPLGFIENYTLLPSEQRRRQLEFVNSQVRALALLYSAGMLVDNVDEEVCTDVKRKIEQRQLEVAWHWNKCTLEVEKIERQLKAVVVDSTHRELSGVISEWRAIINACAPHARLHTVGADGTALQPHWREELENIIKSEREVDDLQKCLEPMCEVNVEGMCNPSVSEVATYADDCVRIIQRMGVDFHAIHAKMSVVQAASIYAFTRDYYRLGRRLLHEAVNTILQDVEIRQQYIRYISPYIALFQRAIRRMPGYAGPAFRGEKGVNKRLTENLLEEKILYRITSFSRKIDVSLGFAGATGERTLYVVPDLKGYDIQRFACLEYEAEVQTDLLTPFTVKDAFRAQEWDCKTEWAVLNPHRAMLRKVTGLIIVVMDQN